MIKNLKLIIQLGQLNAPQGNFGTIRTRQWPVWAQTRQLRSLRSTTAQFEQEFIRFKTSLCILNISAPGNHIKMVLYSKLVFRRNK